jgi:hypothetical protein
LRGQREDDGEQRAEASFIRAAIVLNDERGRIVLNVSAARARTSALSRTMSPLRLAAASDEGLAGPLSQRREMTPRWRGGVECFTRMIQA